MELRMTHSRRIGDSTGSKEINTYGYDYYLTKSNNRNYKYVVDGSNNTVGEIVSEERTDYRSTNKWSYEEYLLVVDFDTKGAKRMTKKLGELL